MGDRAGICLASFHIIRTSSLGPSLKEKAFSDSDAEPLDKIKGCKAAVVWVKVGGLARGQLPVGQLTNRMGSEEVETSDCYAFLHSRPRLCKQTCSRWGVQRRVSVCACLLAPGPFSPVPMCNVIPTEPGTGTE